MLHNLSKTIGTIHIVRKVAIAGVKHNQDKANNTNTYKPGPGLPLSVVMKVKPVFEELSTDKLLRKCLHGLTQNQNESFNATIWERLPKNTFCFAYATGIWCLRRGCKFQYWKKSECIIDFCKAKHDPREIRIERM